MDRVKTWCKYTWDNQKTFDERTILQHLPEKVMTGNRIRDRVGLLIALVPEVL